MDDSGPASPSSLVIRFKPAPLIEKRKWIFTDLNNSAVLFTDSKSFNVFKAISFRCQKWNFFPLFLISVSLYILFGLSYLKSSTLIIYLYECHMNGQGRGLEFDSILLQQDKPNPIMPNHSALGTFLRLEMCIDKSHFFKLQQ